MSKVRKSVRKLVDTDSMNSRGQTWDGDTGFLSQTFPRRTTTSKQFSFSKLVGNQVFHKAIGAMRRRHHANMTVAGTRPLISLAKWRHHTKNKKPRLPPGELFRRYSKLAVLCVRMCKTSYESLESVRNEFLSVSQYSQEFETAIDKDGLVFDPSQFKANKEGQASVETKRILQTRLSERTDKDIDHLMVALKSIQSFKDYPRTIQRRLCQVGWYETFGPKRAIIRQGHPPRSFYFILSGTVVVSKFDKRTHDFQILVFLQQGMSFGELAVIKKGVRQATVSSKTNVELLCISVADYRNIFMSGTFKSERDSEMKAFIRSIGFLKKFPIHKMSEEKNQSDCLFHYFHRGQILARDSNNSDWIFIVKSGSVSVLQKLKEVRPNLDQNDVHGDEDETDIAIQQCIVANRPYVPHVGNVSYMRSYRKRKVKTIAMSELVGPGVVETTKQFDDKLSLEKHLTANLPGYFSETERMGLLDYYSIIEEYKTRLVPQINKDDTDRCESVINKQDTAGLVSQTNEDDTIRLILPPISPILDVSTKSDVDKSTRVRKTSKGAYMGTSPVKKDTTESVTSNKKKLSREERINNDMNQLQKRNHNEKLSIEQSLMNRKTMADELDNKPQKFKEQTMADLYPMFIEVSVLERGQYFGVSNLVYGEQPSLSLVSNGAECIMISKTFFLENALASTMDLLRQHECPFPPEDEMQTNLQEFINWKCHRQKVYQRLVEKKQAKSRLKKGFLQSYGGQYSHRTGPI